MYCPICGQQQTSDAVRFCSRCGFTLAGVAQVVANNGVVPFVAQTPNTGKKMSARRKGIRQGAFLMLFALLVPILAVLDFPNAITALFAVAPPILGLLRIIYAAMFESNDTVSDANATNEFGRQILNPAQNFAALPPQPANFNADAAAAYEPPVQRQSPQNYTARNWRSADTGELKTPLSVTEDTTKLLKND